MAPPGIGDSVEGIHAVEAAEAAGRVQRVWVERSRVDGVSTLIDKLEAAAVIVSVVDDVRDRAATAAPQGIVAACTPVRTVDLDEAVARVTPAAVVVLDHLEDPRNVGALARSAVAAGCGALIVSKRRSAPLGATAFKAAAGALEHLAICEVSSIADAIADLERREVWTVGLDAGGTESIFGLQLLSSPVAVVIGGEGSGLSRLVRERVDVVASIPIHGPVESLNASVAASLALYEIARVRNV